MSLSTIIQAEQTILFDKLGIFFAFSNEQLDRQKKEGVEYVSLGAGTICPKENVKAFIEEHANLVKTGIAKDIEKNGKEKIIHRELCNYECFYSGDLDDAIDALEDYGFTNEEIYAVYNAKRDEHADD